MPADALGECGSGVLIRVDLGAVGHGDIHRRAEAQDVDNDDAGRPRRDVPNPFSAPLKARRAVGLIVLGTHAASILRAVRSPFEGHG